MKRILYLGLDPTHYPSIGEITHWPIPFFRLGRWKYSLSRADLSGHVSHSDEEYDFTNSLRGEHRPFIESSLLDQIMSLNIPTSILLKLS